MILFIIDTSFSGAEDNVKCLVLFDVLLKMIQFTIRQRQGQTNPYI